MIHVHLHFHNLQCYGNSIFNRLQIRGKLYISVYEFLFVYVHRCLRQMKNDFKMFLLFVRVYTQVSAILSPSFDGHRLRWHSGQCNRLRRSIRSNICVYEHGCFFVWYGFIKKNMRMHACICNHWLLPIVLALLTMYTFYVCVNYNFFLPLRAFELGILFL